MKKDPQPFGSKKRGALFHHTMHNIDKKVAEKDRVISAMLRDELKRCQEMLAGMQKAIAQFLKGVLSKRKKQFKDKAYAYYSLKYRNGKKVVNKHIPSDQAPALAKKLEERRKLEKETRAYKKRIDYLAKS